MLNDMMLVLLKNNMLYVFLLISPVIILLIISIKQKLVYWRRVVYYFIFVLGLLAYASNNLFVFIGLCIGMVVVVLMDRDKDLNLPLKNITIMVLIFLGVVLLLNRFEIVEMDAGQIFVRFWPIIPLIIGIRYLLSSEENYQAGLVLSEIGAIFIVLNYMFFYGKNMGYAKNPIFFVLLIVFWPLFFLILAINMFLGWRDTGDTKYTSFLWPKKVDSENWSYDHCAIMAVMGSIEVDLTKKDFEFEKVRRKKIRANVTAVFGKVVLKIPEEIVIISDNKIIMDQKRQSRLRDDKSNLNEVIEEGDLTQLLLRNKSILGKIVLKRV